MATIVLFPLGDYLSTYTDNGTIFPSRTPPQFFTEIKTGVRAALVNNVSCTVSHQRHRKGRFNLKQKKPSQLVPDGLILFQHRAAGDKSRIVGFARVKAFTRETAILCRTPRHGSS